MPVAKLRAVRGLLSPRQLSQLELLQAVGYPLGGLTVSLDGEHLVMTPTLGAAQPLVPVNDGLFRVGDELTASLAFTTVDGALVLAGSSLYAERRPRWPFDLLRAGLTIALTLVVLAPLVAGVAGLARRGRQPSPGERPAGGYGLGPLWALAAGVLALLAWAANTSQVIDLAGPTMRAWTIFGATLAYPALVALIVGVTPGLWRRRSAWQSWFAIAVMFAHAGLCVYLGWWGLIGFRSWVY